jgi:hypothetical protein
MDSLQGTAGKGKEFFSHRNFRVMFMWSFTLSEAVVEFGFDTRRVFD